MNKKHIIAISNSGETGKTQTTREFANELLNQYPSYTPIHPIPIAIHPTNDFKLIIEINGKIIGIESQGDPKTNLENRLKELVNLYKCDLIICTTRTRGETIRAVNNIAYQYGYEKIWTSTYKIETKLNQQVLNNLKAKHLIDLVQKLSII